MRLPNADRAVIEERKLREYLLSKSHPIGRFKARFFESLGFRPADCELLAKGLRSLAVEQEAEALPSTGYGRKYLIRGILRGPGGASREVDTIWIIHKGGDIPRLVTVYPR